MITREALLHIPKSNYSYGYDEDTLHIRVRAKKGEVKKATLRIGDPYIWEKGGAEGGNLNAGGYGWVSGEFIQMTKEVETDLYDYFITEYRPTKKRSRYAFVLENDDEEIVYGEKRIEVLTDENRLGKLQDIGNFFCFPYLNRIDVANTPKWVNDTIWYQIFPDRFANGNTDLDPEHVTPWGQDPKHEDFFGGDIQGIIDSLDYLHNLGINGIYLCPIFKATTTHRYDTLSYFDIDQYLGDKEAFKRLVDEAHKRGIRIMLDAVFNHIGFFSPQWQDVVKNNEQSKYKDWFHIHKFPVVDQPLEELNGNYLNYETFGRVANMPKINTENPEVIEYFLEVGRYWVSEFDIDAWRIDVANEVDHHFWREFRKAVRSVKPDVYILGEIWHDSLPWVMGDQFDAVMNYPLTDAINSYFSRSSMSAEDFKYAVNKVQVSYPLQVNEVTFNLLDSHDTTRIIDIANGNIDRVKLAYLFMFTQSGSPCIYYGDEVGLNGYKKEHGYEWNRQCMIWDEDKHNKDLFLFVQKLIKIRKDHPSLRSTHMEWVMTDNDTNVVMIKKETITIIFNNSEHAKYVHLPEYLAGTTVNDLFSDKKTSLTSSIGLKPLQYLVLEQK
ncbi:glycoside hydrolase family 13 protein [Haloplasma contractile]|uniref:Maltodextrin glucosidase protein n=1 Tax=Haloplasma contractile SSD-17B TaxID=1033810 RepID=F7PTQ8_9MOLU|nr:glycoside hydrolase family 13 protein [Haloplasma contractile]ERJ12221.1 Maltodextrin glucosidase protein [Haloplasma contractile SSD-17B]